MRNLFISLVLIFQLVYITAVNSQIVISSEKIGLNEIFIRAYETGENLVVKHCEIFNDTRDAWSSKMELDSILSYAYNRIPIDLLNYERISSHTPKVLISNCTFIDQDYLIGGIDISYLKIEGADVGFIIDNFRGRIEIETTSGIECGQSNLIGKSSFESNYMSFHGNIVIGELDFLLRQETQKFKVLTNSFYLTSGDPLNVQQNDGEISIVRDSTIYPKDIGKASNMFISGMNASLPELEIRSYYGNQIKEFIFDQNFVAKTDSSEVELQIQGIQSENFYFRGNNINCRSEFKEITVSDRVSILDNSFLQTVNLSGVIYSEFSNEIPYKQFLGKIITSVDTPEGSGSALYGNTTTTNWESYYGYGELELSNMTGFNRLLFSHRQLYNIYKERGDLISANAAYTDIKKLETRRIKHHYQTTGGIKNFINWRLNQLLWVYTEFGTDPAKAIMISLNVILFFSLIYMFFPSTWDDFDRSKLIAELKKRRILRVLRNTFLIIINSTILSLNAFVTLGFGSIPTNGIPKYITILQGFIGWFLLGIFSVALINQVLF